MLTILIPDEETLEKVIASIPGVYRIVDKEDPRLFVGADGDAARLLEKSWKDHQRYVERLRSRRKERI